jgi:hypothetical protein
VFEASHHREDWTIIGITASLRGIQRFIQSFLDQLIEDVRASPRLTRAHAAQGGVTLGPEQGELGANFSHLGVFISASLTLKWA